MRPAEATREHEEERLVRAETAPSRGLLETDRRGKGVSYVVKRPLPDGTRPFFVVVRQRAKK